MPSEIFSFSFTHSERRRPILFLLTIPLILDAFEGFSRTSFELAFLYLLTISWPVGFGFIWKSKPLHLKSHVLKILCLTALGLFVGINLWLPIPDIINDIHWSHDIKLEKTSPKDGTIATVFFLHGPTMFNDGETFVNIRRNGTPFKPSDYFKWDFLGDNQANIMIFTGYDARYLPIDLIWVDETHLKVLVPDYDRISGNTVDDYMNHYAVYFLKKLNTWENIEIIYGKK